MKTLIFMLLLVALTSPIYADALEVTQAVTPASIAVGQAVTASVSLKNILTPRAPIELTATATWDDEFGVEQTSSASATIQVVQPIKVRKWAVAIGSLFGLVAGSAKIDGQPVTPALDSGVLTFDLGGRVLAEGQALTLGYAVRAQ